MVVDGPNPFQQYHTLFNPLLFKSWLAPVRPITLYTSQCFKAPLRAAAYHLGELPTTRWQLAVGVQVLDD
jgi:hypothetical protein